MAELSHTEVSRLDKEIKDERRSDVRLAIDHWIKDESNQEVVVTILVKALDRWTEARRKQLLERLGMYALIAIGLSFLTFIGWKGWTGK